MYQILIADDHPLFRDAFADVVEQNFGGSSLLQANVFSTCLMLSAKNWLWLAVIINTGSRLAAAGIDAKISRPVIRLSIW